MNGTQTTNWLCEKCGEVRGSRHDTKVCNLMREAKFHPRIFANGKDVFKWDEEYREHEKQMRLAIKSKRKMRELRDEWSSRIITNLHKLYEDQKETSNILRKDLSRSEKANGNLEYEIERLKAESVELKGLLNIDANDALIKWLNTSAQMAPLIVRLHKAEDELWQYKKTNADLYDKNERLEEQVKDGWKSPDAICQELNAAKKEIERLNKRQLPEGWHVGKFRNGEACLLWHNRKYEMYLFCLGKVGYGWRAPSGRQSYEAGDSASDIIEIDGIKTKAGEK